MLKIKAHEYNAEKAWIIDVEDLMAVEALEADPLISRPRLMHRLPKLPPLQGPIGIPGEQLVAALEIFRAMGQEEPDKVRILDLSSNDGNMYLLTYPTGRSEDGRIGYHPPICEIFTVPAAPERPSPVPVAPISYDL